MSTPSPSAIETLSANAPPRQTRWKFSSVGKCHAEIKKLEVLLGLEPGKPILHIGKANAYHAELEAMFAARGAAARPVAPAVVAAIASPPAVAAVAVAVAKVAVAATAYPARARMVEIARALGVARGVDHCEGVSDANLHSTITRECYINNVRFEGMESDESCSTWQWRKTSSTRDLFGVAKASTADLQEKLNSI
jgi:hypothetical protein